MDIRDRGIIKNKIKKLAGKAADRVSKLSAMQMN